MLKDKVSKEVYEMPAKLFDVVARTIIFDDAFPDGSAYHIAAEVSDAFSRAALKHLRTDDDEE